MPGVAVQGGLVAFDELHSSPTAFAGREARSMTRNGYVAWGDLPALFAEAFPAPPTIFGQCPAVSYLFCDTVEAQPFYPDGGAPQESFIYTGGVLDHGGGAYSQKARTTITYSLLDFDEGGGGGEGDPVADFISKNTAIGAEFMTLPNSGLWWKKDASTFEPVSADGLGAHIILPSVIHNFTVHRASTLPLNAVRTCIGRVCRDAFYGAAAYSLLYLGCQSRYSRNSLGQLSMSIDHSVSERRFQADNSSYVDWRHWYSPEHKKFLELLKGPADDRASLYATKSAADFNDLFVV